MLLRGHQGEGIGGAAAVKEPVPQLLESMCSTNMRVLTNTGEGAGGEGAFKEAEGTGMGEGHGAKDVSDQIEDQDQLLGAQQKDAPPEEPQEQTKASKDGALLATRRQINDQVLKAQ